jgi:hypothetical protein
MVFDYVEPNLQIQFTAAAFSCICVVLLKSITTQWVRNPVVIIYTMLDPPGWIVS